MKDPQKVTGGKSLARPATRLRVVQFFKLLIRLTMPKGWLLNPEIPGFVCVMEMFGQTAACSNLLVCL
jgi:hypothetical protein